MPFGEVTGVTGKLDGLPSGNLVRVSPGDSYSNTVSIKTADQSDYEIKSVTFSGTTTGWTKSPTSGAALSYDVSNTNIRGNVTITISVVATANPTYNVSYIVTPEGGTSSVKIDGNAIDPDGYNVNQGTAYSAAITAINGETIVDVTSIEPGFSYSNGTVTLPNTVTDDVEIVVVLATSLTINPDSITTTEGTPIDTQVTATTTCETGTISLVGTAPTGIQVGNLTSNNKIRSPVN